MPIDDALDGAKRIAVLLFFVLGLAALVVTICGFLWLGLAPGQLLSPFWGNDGSVSRSLFGLGVSFQSANILALAMGCFLVFALTLILIFVWRRLSSEKWLVLFPLLCCPLFSYGLSVVSTRLALPPKPTITEGTREPGGTAHRAVDPAVEYVGSLAYTVSGSTLSELSPAMTIYSNRGSTTIAVPIDGISEMILEIEGRGKYQLFCDRETKYINMGILSDGGRLQLNLGRSHKVRGKILSDPKSEPPSAAGEGGESYGRFQVKSLERLAP